ncbi:hypothetical protein MFRU_002g03810 [Monilinia fructicola]|uniref:Uncharacterized protein n=1 Tax=Monilinia fructicola TaxID=38448 RepID=A0A5M9K491_MONFR|nr:hypothetical protein EYC84_004204 [Monilinia fructicola]KAG4035032.1 hypothetical protein MFRU_002g03810 [Monilinia fructicola]
MAQSDTWSTRTNSPSVDSHRFKTSSKDKGKATKSNSPNRQTENTPSSQPTEEPDYSSGRVSEYVADPINPIPGYEYRSVEESMDAHTADMRVYLDSYDVTWNHASQ